jgi:hypothetical protein
MQNANVTEMFLRLTRDILKLGSFASTSGTGNIDLNSKTGESGASKKKCCG